MSSKKQFFDYFEDDTLAKDWYNDFVDFMTWKAFEHQEDWIYMLGELGEGRKPCVKKNFYEYFSQLFDKEMLFFKQRTIDKFLEMYYNDDIDVPQEIADEHNWANDYDEDDPEFIKGIVVED